MKSPIFARLMGIRSLWGVLALVCLLTGACRSDFEKVRLSNDAEKIYEAANKYFENEEYLRAQTLYELVLSQFRGRPEAETLFFRYAYTHYYQRQYTLASHYFRSFSNTFAYSTLREEADFMAAYSNYQLSPNFRLEQSKSKEAIEAFQNFINRYPTSARVAECNRLIDEMRAKLEMKAYSGAQLYYEMSLYEAAIQSFENLLRDFPDTHRAESVRFKIIEAAYRFAGQSIYEKRKERYELAMEKYMNFNRKYPRSQYKAEAKMIYEDCQEQIKNLNQ
jgi:outer membrane protein assembly factor BamD